MLSEILQLIEDEGIHLEWWDFVEPISAVYVEVENCKIIGLKSNIDRNNRKLKCSLAEELGHYFTGSTYPNKKPENYSQEIEIAKREYKAKKWQVFLLIPEEKFLEAVKNGITEVWELAECFDVEEEVIRFYLKLPRVREKLIRMWNRMFKKTFQWVR